MLFSSMIFIWAFLPIVIIVNYFFNLILRKSKNRMHVKNVFLLIASLVFYAWGGIYFCAIMLFSILINFLGGYIVSAIDEKSKFLRGFSLFLVIFINLLVLIYFKYFNMILVIIEQVLAKPISNQILFDNIVNMKRTYAIAIKDIVLPIGISFFTFQAMSYVIDVYRGNAKPQKNILDFGLYVALFPQLIAGPIVKYADVALQINDRKETSEKFLSGVKRFCYGLGKKVIIANTFASIVDDIWALDLSHIGLIIAWFGAISYAMQIYYDFSGYSDMAIGLGRIFGFEFKENFHYPYMATSIVDFWRRWHISLTSWFREYVYFPLGGSKKGDFRTSLNIFIVFLLTGIWHGANWTFIIWGLVFAIIQIFERVFLMDKLKRNPIKFINWLYAMLVVMFLWILFRANNIYDALIYIKQLFIFDSKYSILTYLSMKVIIALILAVLGMGVLQKIFDSTYSKVKNEKVICFFDFIIQMLILFYSILSIVSGTYNPFIYFQF